MNKYEINWEAQWQQHAFGFKDGLSHIPIAGKTILLEPGPGFGDLSHPTTKLMLKLMKDVENKKVLDVGCGSGILSFAAHCLGAAHIWGIDIDDEALVHANRNKLLNNMQSIEFMRPEEYKDQPDVILINMIRSEQKIAWNSLPHLHKLTSPHVKIMASGILSEERDRYLLDTIERGWKIQYQLSKANWLSFCFIDSPQ